MSEAADVALVQLVRTIASADHGLSAQLVCAVVEQESGWNCWAVRYEPQFMAKYVSPLYTANKISATECYTRAMSFGLMQLMGQVAREQGFDGQFLTELCDPATGVEFGCRKLKACFDRADGDETKALLAWNGGGNGLYPGQVLARKANYAA